MPTTGLTLSANMMQSPTDQTLALSDAKKATLGWLRQSLGSQEAVTAAGIANPGFWHEVYSFAKQQGVASLIFETLKTLPEFSKIPRDLKIKWGLETDTAIRKYRYYCKTAPEFENFFSPAGMVPVHMKGLALSLLYPRPELREFGDYDFFLLNLDTDPSLQNITENALAGEKLTAEAGIEVNTDAPKHSSWDFRHVHVECHRFLLATNVYKDANPVEGVLHTHLLPVEAQLPGEFKIHIAAPEFAKLFVPFHAMQHSGSGLRLRHIADWAMTCRAYGPDLPFHGYSEALRRGVASLNSLSNLLLATDLKADDDKMLTGLMLDGVLNPDKYERLDIEHEILGAYPSRLRKWHRRHRLKKALFPSTPSLPVAFAQTMAVKMRLKVADWSRCKK